MGKKKGIKNLTIIIALKDQKNKRILLASDKQETMGQIKNSCNDKIIEKTIEVHDGYDNKIRTDKIYFGLSGWGFISNYLKYTYTMPPIKDEQNIIDYLYNDFLYGLREELTERKLLGMHHDVFDSESGMIIVYRDEIYEVFRRFSIGLVEQEYCVGGSGWELAIGSLYTNLHFPQHEYMDAEDIIRQAIITCGANTIYCDTNVNLKIINY